MPVARACIAHPPRPSRDSLSARMLSTTCRSASCHLRQPIQISVATCTLLCTAGTGACITHMHESPAPDCMHTCTNVRLHALHMHMHRQTHQLMQRTGTGTGTYPRPCRCISIIVSKRQEGANAVSMMSTAAGPVKLLIDHSPGCDHSTQANAGRYPTCQVIIQYVWASPQHHFLLLGFEWSHGQESVIMTTTLAFPLRAVPHTAQLQRRVYRIRVLAC